MAFSILGHPAAYSYPEGFLAPARRRFAKVEHRIIGDTWRIPSSHFLMILAAPR
jgi:hypothetical protein